MLGSPALGATGVESSGTTSISESVGIEAVGNWILTRLSQESLTVTPSFELAATANGAVLAPSGSAESLTISANADGVLVGGTIMTRDGISVSVCGSLERVNRSAQLGRRSLIVLVAQYN